MYIYIYIYIYMYQLKQNGNSFMTHRELNKHKAG